MRLSREEQRKGELVPPGSELDEKQEVDLSSLLDLQDRREEHETQSSNRIIFKTVLRFSVFLLVLYVVIPPFRRGVNGLALNVVECFRPEKPAQGPDPIASTYQELMDKLGSRSVAIDRATRSMGVDPRTVHEDGMDPEMKAMMGKEGGMTPGERERVIEGVAHLAGVEIPKPHDSEAEQPESEEPPQAELPKVELPQADSAPVPDGVK